MNIMVGNTIEVVSAVIPKNVDDWEILKMGSCNVKKRFCKGEGGVDNDMDSD